LDQSCIDELCCRNAATYRRYPLNAFLDPQSLEGRTKIVASHGDESDPWTRAQCWLVPRDAFLPGDQKYGHGGNREQESVDVDPAALRYDDLSRVASQSKGRSERDQLRMPDGEERSPMDAASASKDRIGPYTTESLINQMLVSCATAERAGIRPAGIAILRLDEHQRHRRAASAYTHEAKFAPVVQSTPWIPDALQACVLTPVERRRQPFDVGNGRLSGFVCYKALKSDRLGHIISVYASRWRGDGF
jgi:hypothetical protein